MSNQFTFDCPECSVDVVVDDPIRAQILVDGCVLCGAPVGTDAFSRADPATSG
ncbi:DUF7560 family zinc ribbon protein [Halostella litorea]|uniref:DUF7560 family zinc ribbon protein n=1 Tax=Halostella litorea TaxID=2528831 RepID=UPI00192A31CA|nr:hypothetical protein [Halostella litorea]